MNARTRALFVGALVLAFAGTAGASVEEGVIAYQRGDFAAALSVLEPEAEEEVPISRVYRDQLAQRMTPGQVAEAKRRADAWRAAQQ